MSRTPKISDGRKQPNPPASGAGPVRATSGSILISNYNYGAYLGDAIESALQQTYDKLEVVSVMTVRPTVPLASWERYRSLDRRIRVVFKPTVAITRSECSFSQEALGTSSVSWMRTTFSCLTGSACCPLFATAPHSGLAVTQC